MGWAKRKIIDDALDVGSQISEPVSADESPVRTIPPKNDYAAVKGKPVQAKSRF